MTKYKKATEIRFTHEEESRFRELMNGMAHSVEGYNGRKIGDVLKIVSVHDTPFYKLVLKTQNDTRTVRSSSEQFVGQAIPQRTIFSESDFDKWKVCEAPKPYRNANMAFYVRGSKHVESCPICASKGVVTCKDCGGGGTIKCGKCGGKGVFYNEKIVKETCPSCRGIGGTKEIDVAGHEIGRYHCPKCGGNGYVSVRRQISETCSKCNGSGRNTCETCKGKGMVTCGTCGGNGKMVHYFAVDQKAFVNNDIRFILTGNLSSEDKAKYVKSFNRTDGKIVFQHGNDGNIFDRNIIDNQDFMTSTLRKMSENIVNSANNRIIYNEFIIFEFSAKTVTYRVDKKDYTCILQGDSWDIFSVTSPISEFMDDLKEKVISLSKMRRYGNAWTLMKRVLKFPQAGENERKVKDELEAAMKNSTKLGTRFAYLVFVIGMLPMLLHYFENYELLSPWAHWIVDKLHVRTWLGIVFYLIFDALCLKAIELPKFTYLREKMLTRLGLGFLYSIVCQVFILLAFIFLNWLGLIPICDLILYIVIYIIAFIIVMISLLFKWIF